MSRTDTSHKHQHHMTWTRDGFLISTDPSLVHVPSLQRAFDSEEIYWAKAMPETDMRTMLDNSLVFGLYSPTPLLLSPPSASGTDVLMDSTAAGTTRSSTLSDPASTLHEIAEGVHYQQQHHTTSTSTTGDDNGGGSSDESSSSSPSSLIGFARGITDRVTFFYLTDVYVLSEWRGQGLGKWLVQCVQEVVGDMPHLRRSMLVVGHGREEAEAFYNKLMKMERLGDGVVPMHWKGPGCTF
ncbi:hypothetical protein RBB50_005422 [Rhinocladiella similis]